MSDPSEPQRSKQKPKNGVEEEDESKEYSMFQKPKLDPRSDNKLFKTNQKPDESSRFYFESSKEIQVQHDCKATARLETETDFSKDVYIIHGYRRQHTGSHGPIRASAHIRTTMRFDYQPDICKDYKETGYCGFGDSCKFVHDRGDYKSGLQMEIEWEEDEKIRKRNLALKIDGKDEDGRSNVSDDDDDALPSVCSICRQSFVDPVHHSKNKKCFICNNPTMGLFNTAQEIKRKIAAEGK
ncbi:hypothetical protein MKX03_017287 [Papaver bracteatum]|nr:hypothetical protein MKX03_017287 [Papaver bracteatum]